MKETIKSTMNSFNQNKKDGEKYLKQIDLELKILNDLDILEEMCDERH